jgi:acyl carrier protein
MTELEIYAKLTPIFRDIFGDESIELTPELSASDLEEWDSFKHVTIVATVESTFGIRFRTAEVESMQNLGSMVSHIEKKLAAKGQ